MVRMCEKSRTFALGNSSTIHKTNTTMIELKNKVIITITCDEFFVADSLREIANTIENSELEYNEMRKFEGEHYKASLHEMNNHPEEVK